MAYFLMINGRWHKIIVEKETQGHFYLKCVSLWFIFSEKFSQAPTFFSLSLGGVWCWFCPSCLVIHPRISQEITKDLPNNVDGSFSIHGSNIGSLALCARWGQKNIKSKWLCKDKYKSKFESGDIFKQQKLFNYENTFPEGVSNIILKIF